MTRWPWTWEDSRLQYVLLRAAVFETGLTEEPDLLWLCIRNFQIDTEMQSVFRSLQNTGEGHSCTCRCHVIMSWSCWTHLVCHQSIFINPATANLIRLIFCFLVNCITRLSFSNNFMSSTWNLLFFFLIADCGAFTLLKMSLNFHPIPFEGVRTWE